MAKKVEVTTAGYLDRVNLQMTKTTAAKSRIYGYCDAGDESSEPPECLSQSPAKRHRPREEACVVSLRCGMGIRLVESVRGVY